MQPLYTSVKVNNEIELCEVSEPECKQIIERTLLANHISYYIRWPRPSIFNRKKYSCIFCVNDICKDEAENIIRSLCDDKGFSVRFILKKSQNNYL
jgi:hypothetical protein